MFWLIEPWPISTTSGANRVVRPILRSRAATRSACSASVKPRRGCSGVAASAAVTATCVGASGTQQRVDRRGQPPCRLGAKTLPASVGSTPGASGSISSADDSRLRRISWYSARSRPRQPRRRLCSAVAGFRRRAAPTSRTSWAGVTTTGHSGVTARSSNPAPVHRHPEEAGRAQRLDLGVQFLQMAADAFLPVVDAEDDLSLRPLLASAPAPVIVGQGIDQRVPVMVLVGALATARRAGPKAIRPAAPATPPDPSGSARATRRRTGPDAAPAETAAKRCRGRYGFPARSPPGCAARSKSCRRECCCRPVLFPSFSGIWISARARLARYSGNRPSYRACEPAPPPAGR